MANLYNFPEFVGSTMERDAEGHREYKVVHQIRRSLKNDGPYSVLNTPGLPLPGAYFYFGNDIDPWAWCRPTASIARHVDEQGTFWRVTQTFSTKPIGEEDKDKEKCQDQQIEDPLMEPPKISGSFVIYQEEATFDKDGFAILSSSGEPIRGAQVEFDRHKAKVVIQQNVADLQLPLLTAMANTVNDAPLWGMAARCIKFTPTSWERHYHGQCSVYYSRTLEFDVDSETFDRTVLDEGTKVLNGRWGTGAGDPAGSKGWVELPIDGGRPDFDNASHWTLFKDRAGNPAHCIIAKMIDGSASGYPVGLGSDTIVNSIGIPIPEDADVLDEPHEILIQKYEASNFLLLGIPLTL
jgi:hypothetical protein